MAQVTVEVNGKPYGVGCETGQESHVRALATLIDAKVREIAPEAGPLGDTRLMLLGALMLADDLNEAHARLAAAEARAAQLESEIGLADDRAVEALESAAQKLEAMAGR